MSEKDAATAPPQGRKLVLSGTLRIPGWRDVSRYAELAAVIVLAGCGPSAEEQARRDNPNGLRADQSIKMPIGSYGCESIEDLRRAIEHSERSEMEAAHRITNNMPFCFSGAGLDPKQTFTVLQVRGPLMEIGVTTLAQYDTAKDMYRRSYWTLAAWGRP